MKKRNQYLGKWRITQMEMWDQEFIDMEKEGLEGPSSTWTYLINDNPFGDWAERTSRAFGKMFRKGFKSL